MSTETLESLLVQAIRAACDKPDRRLFDTARRHLVDCAGVALAGAVAPAVVRTATGVESCRAGEDAALLGSSRRVSMQDAALVNGMAAHFHDFDDDDPALSVGHPTVPIFAALSAIAYVVPLTVDQALAAYVAGVETTMRLGRIVNPGHYDAGFHATATLGVFGATAASAMLLDLDDNAVEHALGLAASLSSGLKANFGSDGKSLQVGAASSNAVLATRVAAAGVRAAPGALFGRSGFCAVHGGTGADASIAAFGQPFGLREPGLNIKVHACCSSTHTALDGLLGLMDAQCLVWSDVERIEAWIGPDVPGILIVDVPADPLQGKFSLRYCLATAAVFRQVGLDQFEPEAFGDTRVRSLIDRTTVHVDPSLPRIPTGATHASRVRLHVRSGEAFTRQIEDPLGSPRRPVPDEVLRQKFVDCATRCLSEADAERAFNAWIAAPGTGPLSTLFDVLRSEAP